jgi:hypothetical protein
MPELRTLRPQLKREQSRWQEFGWIHTIYATFKGIFCDDVSEFESYQAQQIGLPPAAQRVLPRASANPRNIPAESWH